MPWAINPRALDFREPAGFKAGRRSVSGRAGRFLSVWPFLRLPASSLPALPPLSGFIAKFQPVARRGPFSMVRGPEGVESCIAGCLAVCLLVVGSPPIIALTTPQWCAARSGPSGAKPAPSAAGAKWPRSSLVSAAWRWVTPFRRPGNSIFCSVPKYRSAKQPANYIERVCLNASGCCPGCWGITHENAGFSPSPL